MNPKICDTQTASANSVGRMKVRPVVAALVLAALTNATAIAAGNSRFGGNYEAGVTHGLETNALANLNVSQRPPDAFRCIRTLVKLLRAFH